MNEHAGKTVSTERIDFVMIDRKYNGTPATRDALAVIADASLKTRKHTAFLAVVDLLKRSGDLLEVADTKTEADLIAIGEDWLR